MVWNTMSSGMQVPGFWNAFPFHPHPPGDLKGNRQPTNSEISVGSDILKLLCRILRPRRVFPIGRAAEHCLADFNDSFVGPYISHPSNGRLRQFQAGLSAHKII
jgi:uracil-DNA glycosylase